MNSFQQFLLVLFILATTSCTFGDGPELIAPESSDANAVIDVSDSNAADSSADADESNSTDSGAATNESNSADSGTAENGSNSADSGSIADGSSTQDSQELADEPQGTESNTTVDDTAPEQETEVVGLPNNANNTAASTQVVRIPRTDAANAPIIDGNTVNYIPNTELLDGEWRFAAQVDGLGDPLTIGRLMFGTPLSNDSVGRHHWAAMHDGVYLYLLVVSDDAGVHFQDTDELRKPWKDDSVEIYFDGNNSKLEQYDGVDDFHLTVNLQASDGVANRHDHSEAKLRQSEASATLPSDLNFATGPQKGPVSSIPGRGRADIYELRIKLSELNIQIDSPFGIELQINDDDDGGTRDRKWAWSHPEGRSSDNDYTWQNPSYMADAILVR